MKKVFFSLLAVAAMLFAGDKVKAQQQPMKIGIFDIDKMVTVMPGYRSVDSLLEIYRGDSLETEHQIYISEYSRLDSTYKADSAHGKTKAVLEYSAKQRQQVMLNLLYWQQISQNKLEQKRGMLAQPLYEKVITAYKKILDTKKYTLILKPEALEQGTTGVDNIFELVAKELKIKLPNDNGAAPDQQDDTPAPAPAKPAAKKPAAKG